MKIIRLLPLLALLFVTTIISAQEKNIYWVGGQGNWSDLNKWRTQNGLIPNEVPDENTNVFFNQNSFLYPSDTVFITTGNPTCKSMTWQNIQDTVVIFGGSATTKFNIFGSITLHQKVKNRYMGPIYFASPNAGNTITCAGSSFPGDISFNGTGSWILMDTLFVYDSTDWKAIIDDFVEPLDPNPVIFHTNGFLNANGQTIITRGFASTGNKIRQLNIQDCDILLAGEWTINAENLTFNAANSYFLIAGSMNHSNGTILTYHDIDFQPLDGTITNTKIRTVHRKIHFLGSGTLNGNRNPGMEGMFTIDTLLFEGAWSLVGPIPCFVRGPNHNIHYTEFCPVDAQLPVPCEANTINSTFHRVDYNGMTSRFIGRATSIDSLMFLEPKGYLEGHNTVNDLLYFKTDGVVSANVGPPNMVNNAVFSGDGIFEGSNSFNHLLLSNGFWYQIQTDSVVQPGSIYTQTHKQTVWAIEMAGFEGCGNGNSLISSKNKYTQGLLNYLGPPITLKGVFVTDVNNIGNTITIVDGIDLGNNNGFIFPDLLDSRTLYWVNGTGNWSDPDHWSLTSGGPGGECPPTIRDDVFFDAGSGFAFQDIVFFDRKYAQCNDFTWLPDVPNTPIAFGPDTNNFRIYGSFILNPAMSYFFLGKHYFESLDDDDYESIFLHHHYDGDDYFDLFNQTYFYSETGKWRIDSRFNNYYDTLFYMAGELLFEDDTLSVYNFMSVDTLYRKLSLLGKTLVTLHHRESDGWRMNAWLPDEKIFFDAGLSTIRSVGDITVPMGDVAGLCNIVSLGGELTYHNIEFGWAEQESTGRNSLLDSQSLNTFNLVDYYITFGRAVGTGIVDTLTFDSVAFGCKLDNNYNINFLYAYSAGDTLMQGHVIDTAFFFQGGSVQGGHFIGYLEAYGLMNIDVFNTIDTALFHGNAKILGSNTFSQLILSPNQRYWFQQENGTDFELTTITDDLVLYGFCDAPIRIQSDSIGTQAKILYEALNPTDPDLFASYTSIRDIRMLPSGGNQYIAESSNDLGNNTNIIFNNQGDSEIYYWIGGSGDWGEWWHWSYESGGPPIVDQCTPKERTTVVFDNNSFLTPNDVVTIDSIDNAYCKSMYWIHDGDLFNPEFTGKVNSTLNIFGSAMLNEGMIYNYPGELIFDQYAELNDIPDTLTTFGHTILNNIRLQGINDVVLLGDDLTLFVDFENLIFMSIYHEHGTFNTNGKNVNTGGYFSVYQHDRTMNIANSNFTVLYDFDRAWWVDADNYNLIADNSNLINNSIGGTIFTENGDYLKYYNVFLNGALDSLYNKGNVVEYNNVELNMPLCLVSGNFIADTVWMKGTNCGMFETSTTNVVILDGIYGSVNKNHKVGRGYVNAFGYINGSNFFNYCVFNDDGVFLGKNEFDTLVLYPGSGDFANQGNKFYFQADTAQVINDSLYVRGNPCSNISLMSLGQPNIAYLRKDYGDFDISADYLNLFSVGAQSENLTFYAGENSSPLPNPNNPPPGWVFDNSLGYIPGFNGRTERFCLGDEFIINAGDFNGDPSTVYFWEGSQFPGSTNYIVTEPGQYQIRVLYFEGCYVDDYINLEADLAPFAVIAEGPFCEGDPIEVFVQPETGNYSFTWFNGETTSSIASDLNYTGGIYVTVTDNANNCKASPNQTILVKPVPQPELALGDDIIVKFGESITLDAGEGTYYEWTSVPEVPIDNPNNRQITVPGLNDPVEYHVYVEMDGCPAEGVKVVSMYPPSRLGVPTAFSPNGDGVNDVLMILGSGFSDMNFKLYNRYGQLVFETNDSTIGWDGTVNGIKQEMEVYTYYIKVVFQDKDVVEETGNITLLR